VPFPQRHINNIYLDSPGLACFYAHVNGTRERFKLRIRWYGAESGLVAQPVLEVKRKTGAVGTKERYPLEPFEFGPRFRFDALRRAIQARVSSSAIASLLGDVEPSLFNRYRRSYFLSADGRFRLTVDSELGFRPLGPLRVAAQRGHAAGGAIIVELKSDVGDDASRIVQRLPYRLSKYSKYVQGIGRLYGLEI
jgi:SPX domain protein involved in polyphosphate accumulation